MDNIGYLIDSTQNIICILINYWFFISYKYQKRFNDWQVFTRKQTPYLNAAFVMFIGIVLSQFFLGYQQMYLRQLESPPRQESNFATALIQHIQTTTQHFTSDIFEHNRIKNKTLVTKFFPVYVLLTEVLIYPCLCRYPYRTWPNKVKNSEDKFYYYTAELANRSVRKMKQAAWLPSRAICFSYKLACFSGEISE